MAFNNSCTTSDSPIFQGLPGRHKSTGATHSLDSNCIMCLRSFDERIVGISVL
jgi:hypothetical protein